MNILYAWLIHSAVYLKYNTINKLYSNKMFFEKRYRETADASYLNCGGACTTVHLCQSLSDYTLKIGDLHVTYDFLKKGIAW